MSDVQPGGPFRCGTDRLALRFVREEDVETLTAYRNDPDVNALQDWDLPLPGVPGAGSWSLPTRASPTSRPGYHHQVAIELDGELVGDVTSGSRAGVASPRSDPGSRPRRAAGSPTRRSTRSSRTSSAITASTGSKPNSPRTISPVSGWIERLGHDLRVAHPGFLLVARGAWDDNLNYSMTAQEWARLAQPATNPANADPTRRDHR